MRTRCNCESRDEKSPRRRSRGRGRLSVASSVAVLALSALIGGLNGTNRSGVVGRAAAEPSDRSLVGGGRRMVGFGRRRRGRDRGDDDEEEDEEGSRAGPTLGDLEGMMEESAEGVGGVHPSFPLGPGATFGLYGPNARQSLNHLNHAGAGEGEVMPSVANSNQLRRSLRRINLDLSGRIMCHVISPPDNKDRGDGAAHRGKDVGGKSSVPLFSLPTKREGKLHRAIPHIFLGADYDLDEAWYGATRWISKCSWGPSASSSAGVSFPGETDTGAEGGSASSTSSMKRALRSVCNKLFPPSSGDLSPAKSSTWILEAEGGRSAFDPSDSSVGLRLIRSPPSSKKVNGVRTTAALPQISVERDSAKYCADTGRDATRRRIEYAPAITVDVRTPLLHPRLEVRSRKTWVVEGGGDAHGNYYGEDHFGGPSPADRRLEQIRRGLAAGVPRSNPAVPDATPGGRVSTFGGKLSRWMENDGWAPRRVTADLMGNLVSVSEVGFADAQAKDGGVVDDDEGDANLPFRGIFPPVRNAGVRLRVSKRMDWTSLGIFPWSENDRNGGGAWTDALRSTRVRLELKGLYGSGEGCASVAVDADPLDWRRTLKFTVGREGVSVLGKRRSSSAELGLHC